MDEAVGTLQLNECSPKFLFELTPAMLEKLTPVHTTQPHDDENKENEPPSEDSCPKPKPKVWWQGGFSDEQVEQVQAGYGPYHISRRTRKW